MMPNQAQAPPLVPVGGTIELVGHLFEVVAHTTDAKGTTVEVPGAVSERRPSNPSGPDKRPSPQPNLRRTRPRPARPFHPRHDNGVPAGPEARGEATGGFNESRRP